MNEFRSRIRRHFYDECLHAMPLGLSPLDRRTSDVDIDSHLDLGLSFASTRAASSRVARSGPELPALAIDAEASGERAKPELLWADANLAGVVMRSVLALAPFFGLCLMFIAR